VSGQLLHRLQSANRSRRDFTHILGNYCKEISLTVHRIRQLLYSFAVISTAVVATVWYALARGQDFNWDQQNYHIGIAFLQAHGTFWDSVAPAGIRSYFNPYVQQAQFFAMQHLSPICFAALLAVLQSMAFMLAGLICAEIARPADGWKALLLGLSGFSLCLMAPMSLAVAGTTCIELLTSVPVLAAYAVLLARGRWLGLSCSGALAGALLGIATALKVTNGLFALGVVGFALAGPDNPRQRLRWMVICAVAGMLAAIAVGGSWQLGLWERFGNPFFPYYNNIFHSPDFDLIDLRDERFPAHSVFDIWRYPLYWLLGGNPNSTSWRYPLFHWLLGGKVPRMGMPTPSTEVAIYDARWIVAISGGTLFLAALLVSRRWGRSRLVEPATGLFFAFVVDYLLWITQLGYTRYMLPLEILCGAIILVLFQVVVPYSLRAGVLLSMAAVSWRILLVPDLGHLPWRPYWQSINPTPLDFGGPAIIFLAARPSSFVAASLPSDARYVGIYGPERYGDFVFKGFDLSAGNNTQLTRQLKQELTSEPNVLLKEIDQGSTPSDSVAVLASYGLRITNQCEMLQVADKSFRICDVGH
jgi:hypothetical protein